MMIKKAVFTFFCCLTLTVGAFAKLYDAQHFTLENGLDVYLIENHRIPVVAHMVVYRVGSADDPLGKSGLAHYHEHMMFKGPDGSASASMMAFVNQVGGSINAVTSYDFTYYYEIVPKEHIETAIKLEAERMATLEVIPEQAASELQVVLEEENMRLGNNPVAQFYQALTAAFYRHHPYRIFPIGWRHEIKQYTPQDVKEFHKQWYAPDNAFVILSGDLTLAEAKSLAEKYYGPIPRSRIKNQTRVTEPPRNGFLMVQQTSNKISEPYLAMMMPAPHYNPKNPHEARALELAVYVLGNSATGLLYRRLVEEEKVAVNIQIDYNMHSLDPGHITIMAQPAIGISPSMLEKAIKDELDKIITDGLTKKQLEKFKTQFFSGVDYIKDSLLAGADHLIAPLIQNVPLDQIENSIQEFEAVTIEQLNTILRSYMTSASYVTGTLMPVTLQDQAQKTDEAHQDENKILNQPSKN